MKKPELVVMKHKGRAVGKCSSCQESVFRIDISTDSSDHENDLERAFRAHFMTVHMREDASQAAARIVREATEEK